MLGQSDEKFMDVATDFQKISDSVVARTNGKRINRSSYTDAERKKGNTGVRSRVRGVAQHCHFWYWFLRSIVLPIKAVTNAMQQLSSGDTEVEVGYRDRRDEIGQMVEAIKVFRKTTIEMRALEVESFENEKKNPSRN